MEILRGITTSWKRNPPEERDSAGKHQLIDEEFTLGGGFHRESSAYLHGFTSVRSKCTENPSNGNNSRFSSSKSYILAMPTLKNI
jgi:hypothetical protein